MNKKFNHLLIATAIIGSSLAAQSIQSATNPQNFVGNGQNRTGTSVIDVQGGHIAAHVYESGLNSEFVWENTAIGTGPSAPIIIQGAIDPDIQFTNDPDELFISYFNGDGLWLEKRIWNGTSFIQTNLTMVVAVNPIAYWQNLDFEDGRGIITWYDDNVGGNQHINLRAFDQGLNFGSTANVGVPGRAPDVAVCTSIDKYYLTFHDGAAFVYSGVWSDLYNTATAPSLTYSGIPGAGIPRIASPHNLTQGINPDSYTVVANYGGSGIMGIFYSPSTGVVEQPIYLATNGEDHWEPAVTYNADRVKCVWSAQHAMQSVGKDILCAEMDLTNYFNMHPYFFEVSINGGIPEGYFLTSPSVAETRTNPSVANSDYNSFLYTSDLSNVYNKLLNNTADPKRMGIGGEESDEWSWTQSKNEIAIEGNDLSQFRYNLVDVQGKVHDISSRIQKSEDLLLFNTNGLTSGIYFLQGKSDSAFKNIQFMIK